MVTLWTMSGLHYNRWLLTSDRRPAGETVHQPRTLTKYTIFKLTIEILNLIKMNYDEKNFLIRLFTAMFQGLEHHNCSVIPNNTKQADISRLIIFQQKILPIIAFWSHQVKLVGEARRHLPYVMLCSHCQHARTTRRLKPN